MTDKGQVSKQVSRRLFLKGLAVAAGGMALAACGPAPTPQVVEKVVTKEVEKVVKETVIVEGTPKVIEKVIEKTPEAPQIVQVEVWNGIGPPEGVLMQDFLNRFENTRPDIKLVQWTTEWEAFYTKIRSTYAEGIGPDLAVTHPRYLAQYGGTVFKPIDDLVAGDADIKPSMFAEKPWKRASYQGKQYGLPLDIHCFALYCNVGLFDAAGLDLPKTEDDLVAAAKALSEPPNRWGFLTRYQGGGLPWEYIGYLAHRGQKGLLDENNTKAAFNNDAGIGALRRMYDNIHTDKISWGSAEGLDSTQAFMTQMCAMRVGGTWEKFDWDTVQGLRYTSLMFMPNQPGTWGSSHLFVLPQMGGREKIQGAWDAAKWVIKSCSVEWGVRAGHVPALLEAAAAEAYLAVKEMQGFRDSVPHIVYLPQVPQHEAISEVMIASLSAALQEDKKVEEALNEAESKVNEILSTA